MVYVVYVVCVVCVVSVAWGEYRGAVVAGVGSNACGTPAVVAFGSSVRMVNMLATTPTCASGTRCAAQTAPDTPSRWVAMERGYGES